MARENVSYTEFTCDICGTKLHVDSKIYLPFDWQQLDLGDLHLELCRSCCDKIEDILCDMIDKGGS